VRFTLLTPDPQLRLRWTERLLPLARRIGPFAFVLGMAAVAYGHHSIAGVYDSRQEITVEGVVTDFQFVSPHPFLSVNVVRDGNAEAWRFDMDDRNEMREIGMAADTFRPGDRLVVTGSLAAANRAVCTSSGSRGHRTDSATSRCAHDRVSGRLPDRARKGRPGPWQLIL
jgi:hypothetical protein